MKRYISTFLCFALLFSQLLFVRAKESKSVYLALGDSISTGYEIGGSHLSDENFVNIIAQNNQLEFENKAVDGNKADGILKQIKEDEITEIIKDAKLVTITCGGNDMLYSLYTHIADTYNEKNPNTPINPSEVLQILGNVTDTRNPSLLIITAMALNGYDENDKYNEAIQTFLSTINEITSYIKEQNKDAVIILATQYNPYHWFTGATKKLLADPVENCIVKLREAVIDNKTEGQYYVADVYTDFNESEERLSNATQNPLQLDFHPSVEGHAVIADSFQSVIKTVEWPGESKVKAFFGKKRNIVISSIGVVLIACAITIPIVNNKKRMKKIEE